MKAVTQYFIWNLFNWKENKKNQKKNNIFITLICKCYWGGTNT